MKPILRLIDVEVEDTSKITLTKEQLEDIINQAYQAGVADGTVTIPTQPTPIPPYEPLVPPTTPIQPSPNPLTPFWYVKCNSNTIDIYKGNYLG